MNVKTNLTGIFILLATSGLALAQVSNTDANALHDSRSAYSVVERGPHHRVWSRVTWETNALGRAIAHTNSYTELETGMHYLQDGRWLESSLEITLTPGGAIATKGPHKVS